jgi:hypothetical protein
MSQQYISYSSRNGGGGGGGVSSLNGLVGSLSLIAGSGITITPSGSSITIASTGSSGANTSLSNLNIPTAINTDLTFAGVASLYNILTPSVTGSANSSEMQIKPGDVVNGQTGGLVLSDGNATGTGNAVGVSINGGDALGSGQGGIVQLSSGSSSTGTPGNIQIYSDAGIWLLANNLTNAPILRFYEGSDSFYNGFRASNSLSANVTWTWPLTDGTSGQFLKTDGLGNLSFATASGGSGTVTSVAIADSTNTFNISGSPVTTAGTLTLSGFKAQSQNAFLAGPSSGGAGAASWRLIAAGDIPTLNQNTTGTASNITASSNSTLTTLSSLSLPGAQVTGNISGNAANITATSNSTLTTLTALSLPASQLSGQVSVANGGTSLSTLTANNVILGNGTSAPLFVAPGTSGNVLTSNGTTWSSTAPATSGTVTSVGLSTPGVLYTVSGSPVTTSGTLTLNLVSQSANTVFAGPASGGSVAPTFRSLVAADLPAGTGTVTSVAMTVPAFLSVSGSPVTTSGTLAVSLSGTALPVANGGTGDTTLTANNLLVGAGTSPVTFIAPGTNGQVLTSNGTVWSAQTLGTNSVATATVELNSTITSLAANSTIVYDTVITDTNSAYSAGTYTIPFTGNWLVAVDSDVSAGGGTIYVAKNGTNIGYLYAMPAINTTSSGSAIFPFTAGDAVTIRCDTTDTFVGVASPRLNRFSISLQGGVTTTQYSVQTISGNTTAVLGVTYMCNTSGGAFNLTLPTPVINGFVSVKDSTGSFNTNNLTIVRHASENIEGVAASKIMQSNWGFWTFLSNGTDWFLV